MIFNDREATSESNFLTSTLAQQIKLMRGKEYKENSVQLLFELLMDMKIINES